MEYLIDLASQSSQSSRFYLQGKHGNTYRIECTKNIWTRGRYGFDINLFNISMGLSALRLERMSTMLWNYNVFVKFTLLLFNRSSIVGDRNSVKDYK